MTPPPASIVPVALLAMFASACSGAALTVTVADDAGQPLGDAVALLEPLDAKPAVKPLADVEISQSKRRFQPRVTLITVGTRVAFPNFDTVRHHVYSFSPIKTFELKLYAGVPGVPVVFDQPGVAVLGCNIHDSMAAWVVVADTPWSARSSAGTARIEGVPPGRYRLHLWHPGLPPGSEGPVAPLTVGTADLQHSARLAVAGGS